MKAFILKYWLFILLATLASTLAVIFFLNRGQEEVQRDLLSIPSPEIESVSILVSPNTVNLKNKFPIFEKNLNIYEVQESSFSDQEALSIALNFGFSQSPTVTKFIYSWATEFNNLSIYLKEGIVGYGLNLLNHPELISSPPPTIKEAENQGREFLKKEEFLIPQDIELQIDEQYYAKIESSYFVPSKQEETETTLVYIRFNYQLNDKKIKGPGTDFISFYIGSDFKIARFDYNKIFKDINLLNSYPLKTKNEVLNSIQTDPKISYLKNQDKFSDEYLPIRETVSNLRNLSFENIELIYYKQNSLQSYLQPVFLITGTAQLKNGEVLEVGLYLPAIKDEYLLTP